jgi:hypothetical protein
VELAISEFQREILRILYEQWFKDYFVGVSVQNLVRRLGCKENEANRSLEILKSYFLVEKTEIPNFCRITVLGMDVFERGLAPSLFNNKIEERKTILEILLELYQKDTKETMHSNELMKQINSSDHYYLQGNVEYLTRKGLVRLSRFHGGNFFIRLTGLGFQSLQDVIIDNARVMSAAYEILFRIENVLRKFIESKLRSKYGSDWWDCHVSGKVKEEASKLKQFELRLSWKVSQSKSITDYLLFEHLALIIKNNWDVFKPVFHKEAEIGHRLAQLESIRNSIAHTRILTQDGMDRLSKYSDDIKNMIGPNSS